MDWLLLAIVASALLAGYLLPSIIAVARKAPSAGSAVVINVLLGWTLIGWAVALAVACRSRQPSTVVHVHHDPNQREPRPLR
ncbi:superinfection immunity protein [Flindersiella endophytica]